MSLKYMASGTPTELNPLIKYKEYVYYEDHRVIFQLLLKNNAILGGFSIVESADKIVVKYFPNTLYVIYGKFFKPVDFELSLSELGASSHKIGYTYDMAEEEVVLTNNAVDDKLSIKIFDIDMSTGKPVITNMLEPTSSIMDVVYGKDSPESKLKNINEVIGKIGDRLDKLDVEVQKIRDIVHSDEFLKVMEKIILDSRKMDKFMDDITKGLARSETDIKTAEDFLATFDAIADALLLKLQGLQTEVNNNKDGIASNVLEIGEVQELLATLNPKLTKLNTDSKKASDDSNENKARLDKLIEGRK